MRILIIEDNRSKLEAIKKFFNCYYPGSKLHDALSYTAGLRRVYDESWDLIILDMSLPVYDMNPQDSGGDKKPVAGKEIMKRMRHRNKVIPTIVVTQFDTFGENGITIDSLNSEFSDSMSDIWKGTVNYSNASWASELKNTIDRAIGEKKDGTSANC